MSRLPIKTETLRALFANSGNNCAFPNCTQKLINQKNQFIGQICHIEAANEKGERYNYESTDDYRRGYDNLILLCYPHHIETNDVSEFSVDALKRIKIEHEIKFKGSNFIIAEEELSRITKEMNIYWNRIEYLNKVEHLYLDSELAMEVDGKRNFSQVIKSIRESVKGIRNLLDLCEESDNNLLNDFNKLLKKKNIDDKLFIDIPYYENPFFNRNWELHNLGKPNWFKRLEIDLVHFEILFYQEYIKLNKEDHVVKDKFEKLKREFEDLAKIAIHVD